MFDVSAKMTSAVHICCTDVIADDSQFVAGTNSNPIITQGMFLRTGSWVVCESAFTRGKSCTKESRVNDIISSR